jgi:hypothetical protein
LKFLGKPNTPEDVIALVEQLKAGGVAVGVIILVGAGGAQYAADHVRNSVQLVNALPLDGTDLIYFSELTDYPGSTYAAHAAQAGIRALTPDELNTQQAEMQAALRRADPAQAPRVSYYDIREFVY